MTNLQKAASEFRKALAHSDKGPGAPRSSIELIEKGEALIEAIEKAQSLAAATACADHEAGETGYATFKTRVAHGAQLFLAPPAQAAAKAPSLEEVAKAIFDAREHHAWEDEPEIDRENKWYPMARAAIATFGAVVTSEPESTETAPASLAELTRYDLCVDGDGNENICPCPDGEFLLASDVADMIDKLMPPKGEGSTPAADAAYLVVHKESGYVASIAASPEEPVGSDHTVVRYVPDVGQGQHHGDAHGR